MTLAIYFRTLLLERKPDMKITGSAEKWANEIRLAVEQDKRTLERIKAVMIWTNADSFWQNNVLSISALRKNFDALELRMEKTNKKQPEKKKPRER